MLDTSASPVLISQAGGMLDGHEAERAEAWGPLNGLPFGSWKEALQQIEKKIARVKPAAVGRFALWFAPMPLESIQQRGDELRLRFTCTSPKRKQEALALQPVIEALLAEEFFPGRRVWIELVEQYSPPPAAAASPLSGAAAPDQPAPGQSPERVKAVQRTPAEITQPAAAAPADPLDEPRSTALALPVKPAHIAAELAAPTSSVRPAPTGRGPNQAPARPAPPDTRLPAPAAPQTAVGELLVEPSYATTYDEIVRAHSAIYLPAYFARHLRHMGAADGLRYMALRQVAYLQGLRDASGPHLLPVTVKELCRWSTLQPRRIYGGLEDPGSYLFLLAGKAPYYDYYATRPAASRWEDEAGFHWKSGGRDGGREFCVWKRDGQPTNDCSQLVPDRVTGELQWRQAPLIYRVQLSMPLCPEDEQVLRATLLESGVRDDPLGAIQRCLALPRAELLPDRPARLNAVPRRLYTVQELVMECWGRRDERELAARVAVQARLLEGHLLQAERDLLKIPFYLLEKWGAYLSPAQLWTAILAMDRVFAGAGEGAYRDTTILRNGIKEMTLWTEDEYSKGAARKISKWLYPFNFSNGAGEDPQDQAAPSVEHHNPWFSVFVSEILPETGARVKNADNSVQMKLRVLPMVPLCPEDTLRFARKMGLERLAVRDAAGQALALEITEEELAVYLPGERAQRTLRFSHTGELRHGEAGGIVLRARDRQLGGIELLTSEAFYESDRWPGELFGSLESRSGALSGRLENQPGALFGNLERQPGAFSGNLETWPGALFDRLENSASVLSGSLEKPAGALSGELALDAGALFGMLLKLLILNLYGIKQNSFTEKTPSEELFADDTDSLEQFGSRQGQLIHWAGVTGEMDWEFGSLAKSLGIADVKGLAEKGVTALALVNCALELYAVPAERFNTGRVAVLVARLRNHPRPEPGVYLRIAEQGPLAMQDCLRRAILNVSPLLNDPDWDLSLGKARRDDLIELAERLGLARVIRQP